MSNNDSFDVEKFYSHEEVLERTLLSRVSLTKLVQKKKFPTPVPKGNSVYKSNWYLKEEVDSWLYKNRPQFLPETFFEGEEVTVKLTIPQHIKLKKAAKALETDLQRYIVDAIERKTATVLYHLEME